MVDENELNAQEVGRRLRLARENLAIRQSDAAQVIGVSRPTLVSIEQGSRRIHIQELQLLARHYGVSTNVLLRREAVHIDIGPRFRKLRGAEDASKKEVIQLFNDLIRAEVELENVLGIKRQQNYPPARGIGDGDVVELAEIHAQELRDWLGIGSGPIADIFSVIELELGIRLYQLRLSSNSRVAGSFTYDESVGACILLNANHTLSCRVQSAAHELGHFYGARYTPEIFEENKRFKSRSERYANAFGNAFVTPSKSFSESFCRLKEITGKPTRRLIILLANQYNISRQACCLRLEELGCASRGTWDRFQKHGGITDRQAREVLGAAATHPDPAGTDAIQTISQRMSLMVHAAWERELFSEGQLAELLKISRPKLRAIIDQIEVGEGILDDTPKRFDQS